MIRNIKLWFIGLFIILSLTRSYAQSHIGAEFFVGYNFFSDQYFTPTNNLVRRYIGSTFNSRYIYVQSFTPFVGLKISHEISSQYEISFETQFNVMYTAHDIEDKSERIYYPFGRIELENTAWQFTGTFDYNITNMSASKHKFTIGTGPFIRIMSIKENVIQDAIDAVLDDFPLSQSNMNELIFGLRGHFSFGWRYQRISNKAKYLNITTFFELNSLGMFKNQNNIFSMGLKLGIDFS